MPTSDPSGFSESDTDEPSCPSLIVCCASVELHRPLREKRLDRDGHPESGDGVGCSIDIPTSSPLTGEFCAEESEFLAVLAHLDVEPGDLTCRQHCGRRALDHHCETSDLYSIDHIQHRP
ncbi:hypothetical protein DN540_38310 [Burkholderia multivorans]|nr:hypothetical protein DN540_38310 [Burkholderia multivorans]